MANIPGFNRGEIDFDTLARDIDWAKKWKHVADYLHVLPRAQGGGEK